MHRVTAFDNVAAFDDKAIHLVHSQGGAELTLNDHAFLYASASRGFKSGGFNPGSYQNDAFNPEKIWAYELAAS